MKKNLLIVIVFISMFALYRAQHVKPIEDPRESPIFQQRLQSSLDKIQDGDDVRGSDRKAVRSPGAGEKASSGMVQRSRELVASGMCGQVTLTWVVDKKVARDKIVVKRRDPDEDYEPLPGTNMYEKEEEGGIRYWLSESGLSDGMKYDYLVSYVDEESKQRVKGPVSITLACTERDRELLAQRAKMIKEYYEDKGPDAKESPARQPAPQGKAAGGDLIAAGSCSRLTLTWAESGMIDKSSVRITRKSGIGDYAPLGERKIYHREEEAGGIRYWAADEGLSDGETYQYLVSFKDESGKEVVRGPVPVSLTCTEKDREMIAERDKLLKEYYQKQSADGKAAPAAGGNSPYQLSEKTYTVDPGSSPWKGSKDAPVTIVVFSDFECIHCGTLAQTLETMLKTFPGRIRVVFKNYIIPYHKNSESAAMAALAAGEQKKFWEMHDLLFKNQQALGKEAIMGYAQSLQMDMQKFESALVSRELKNKLDQDMSQGKTLNIQNLPTTFINGRSFMGSPPAEYIKGIIEETLKKGSQS
jgi:protein-disulfide isomerase